MNTNGESRTEFVHNLVEYRIFHVPGVNRLQLWIVSPVSGRELFDHGRSIPEGMTLSDAIEVMRAYTIGAIDLDEYNRLLPPE